MLMCGLLELKQEEQQHKEEIVSTFKSLPSLNTVFY